MFNKLYNFYIDYEELIKYFFILIVVIFFECFIISYFDKELTRDKDIIENTKNYFIFDNCKKFDDKYYCWEEIHD